MIEVSKLNGEKYFVNAETIDFIEETPDTVLTLASGKKIVVLESPTEIVNKIIAYKQKIYLNLPATLADLLDEMREDGKDAEPDERAPEGDLV
jgi:flagellar protein FlbD